MRARALAARHGWLWIVEGWRLFRRQPIQFSTLVMTYILLAFGAILVLQNSGVLASVLAFALALCAPGLSVGFLEGARNAEAGRPIYPNLLIKAFTVSRRATFALLTLGAVRVVVAELLFLVLANIVFDLPAGITDQLDASKVTAENAGVLTRVYAAILLATVTVSLLLWYAAILISWHHLAPLKAIFFSIATLWRNRWAFLVYLLMWAVLFIILPLTVVVLMGLAGLEQVSFVVLLPLGIALAGTLYCSQYATYRAVFAEDPAPTEPVP
jgi:hypothetical protein